MKIVYGLFLAVLLCSPCSDRAWAEGSLHYAGATTLQKYFMPDAAKLFYSETGTRIQIDGGNTDPGLMALQKGDVDLAGAGRFLTPAEKAQGLVEHFLGWDVLAIVVHKTNPKNDLTLEELQAVFSGKTANWQQLGGNDQAIIVVTSPQGAGMRSAVQKEILKGQSYTPNEISAGIVAQADQQVGIFPSGITALSRSMVDDPRVKVIAVNGVEPTAENITAGHYPLAKPLTLVTRGQPKDDLARFIDLATSSRGQSILGRYFVPASRP